MKDLFLEQREERTASLLGHGLLLFGTPVLRLVMVEGAETPSTAGLLLVLVALLYTGMSG